MCMNHRHLACGSKPLLLGSRSHEFASKLTNTLRTLQKLSMASDAFLLFWVLQVMHDNSTDIHMQRTSRLGGVGSIAILLM